jgi:hypothetical protein
MLYVTTASDFDRRLPQVRLDIHYRMVELSVFVAEQFSWYLCFGMIIHQIHRDFTKNIKERLFYNVPEKFASIDEIFSLQEAKNGKINVGRSGM